MIHDIKIFFTLCIATVVAYILSYTHSPLIPHILFAFSKTSQSFNGPYGVCCCGNIPLDCETYGNTTVYHLC